MAVVIEKVSCGFAFQYAWHGPFYTSIGSHVGDYLSKVLKSHRKVGNPRYFLEMRPAPVNTDPY